MKRCSVSKIATAVAGVLMAAHWASAEPGMVTTKDNHVYIGEVDAKTDPEKTQITTLSNEVYSIYSRNVEKIAPFTSPKEEFAALWTHTDRKNAPAWSALAQFAFDHQMFEESKHALQRVLEIDPSNRQAADMLKSIDQKLAATNPPPPPATEPVTPQQPAANPNEGRIRRELTVDEINHIRQLEWVTADRGIRVTIAPEVKAKAVSAQIIDPAQLSQMSANELAWAIVHNGTEAMKAGVRLQTDPGTIQIYHQTVNRFVVASCATGACHNTEKAGKLRLFPEDTPAGYITNFVVLQQFLKTLKGVEYNVVDRTHPNESLLMQFAMPVDAATVPHPKGPGYAAPVKSSNAQLQTVLQWIRSLSPIQPVYDVDLSVDLKKADKTHKP